MDEIAKPQFSNIDQWGLTHAGKVRTGVVLSYLPLMLPLCIIALFVARESVPADLTAAAQDLGASWSRTQVLVVIPLMRPVRFKIVGCLIF